MIRRFAVLIGLLLLAAILPVAPVSAEDPPPVEAPAFEAPDDDTPADVGTPAFDEGTPPPPVEAPPLDLGDDMRLPPPDLFDQDPGTTTFETQSLVDPLGLVAEAEWIRSNSLGHHDIAVWVCQVPVDSTNLNYRYAATRELPRDPDGIATWANATVAPWFAEPSGGRYTANFVPAGTITLGRSEGPYDCARRAVAATDETQFRNVMAIDTSSIVGGLGGYLDSRRGFWVGGGVAGWIEIGPDAWPGVVVHEIGHTLDWPHSHFAADDEYDNPADVMSGLDRSANARCGLGLCQTINTIAFNRYAAGWIDPSQVEVLGVGSHSVTLMAQGESGVQMAVVDLGGWHLTLEARPNQGHDVGMDHHGVAVHTIDQVDVCGNFVGGACWGLARRQQQAVGPGGSWNHVLAPGGTLAVQGVDVGVVREVEGGYEVTVTVGPPPPRQPRQVGATPDDRRATVSWQEPSSSGGGPITGYTATAQPGGRSCSTTGARTCTITGLTNGTVYQVEVQARNAFGSGSPSMPVSVTPVGAGYWMAARDGRVFGFGTAPTSLAMPRPTAAIAAAPNGGYWLLHTDGWITARGANYYGDSWNRPLAPGERFTTMAGLPDGRGYWVFTDRGRVIPFGEARHLGDVTHLHLNGPIVDSVAAPDGNGYYLMGSDGGVFAFGSASFRGSTARLALNQPAVALIPTPDSKGYWVIAADGGVFAFNAPFRDSVPGVLPGIRLNRPIIGGVPYGNGYVLIASDGGAFSFSNQPFLGSLGSNPPSSPIVGLAVRRP